MLTQTALFVISTIVCAKVSTDHAKLALRALYFICLRLAQASSEVARDANFGATSLASPAAAALPEVPSGQGGGPPDIAVDAQPQVGFRVKGLPNHAHRQVGPASARLLDDITPSGSRRLPQQLGALLFSSVMYTLIWFCHGFVIILSWFCHHDSALVLKRCSFSYCDILMRCQNAMTMWYFNAIN